MAEENGENLQAEEDNELAVYSKDAVDVVSFRVVYSKKDLESSRYYEFPPEMAHQIFGDAEKIFGYQSLSITLNYLHNSAQCYVEVKSSGEIKMDNVHPDNIMEKLDQWLPEGYVQNETDFSKILENEVHDASFGKVLEEFKATGDCRLFPNQKVPVNYKITRCDSSDNNFKGHHQRFETYIIWFIDAANFIDINDKRWEIFYVYEEFEHPEDKKKYVTPIGFCSAYKFYAYPDKVRVRISQFMILPSHQRQGIGRKLYHSIVEYFRSQSNVVDITVEEPTPIFQRIRDLDDCLSVRAFLEESKFKALTVSQKILFNKMQTDLKICRKQRLRLYDILTCFEVKRTETNEKYLDFLTEIRIRIRTEAMKNTQNSKRFAILENCLSVSSAMEAGVVEVEVKKYIDDIEASVVYLQKYMEKNV